MQFLPNSYSHSYTKRMIITQRLKYPPAALAVTSHDTFETIARDCLLYVVSEVKEIG